MAEEWKDIAGYEGRYQISNLGRVKTVERYKSDGRRQREAIRKSQIDHQGYEFVLLFNGIKNCRHSVHVLVARAFIPNPHDKPQINHIDGDKTNNDVCNLEWCTASENQRHAVRTGLSHYKYGDENPRTKTSDSDIRLIRELRAKGWKLQPLADRFGVSMGQIGKIVRGERRVYA